MKKPSLYIFIYIFGFTLTGFAQERVQGSLISLMSDIKDAMPFSDSFGFVPPTSAQQDSFNTIVDSILAENYAVADSLANLMDYKLLEWYDTSYLNRRYYVLMEKNANEEDGVDFGWGTYLFFPEGRDQLIIEVPHPLHDVHTWRVGFYLFQILKFKYMLMAGTHRYANGRDPAPADVAHNSINMFHIVHQAVSPHAEYSYQVHGFSRSDYPDIVLSNGSSSPYPVLDTLATELGSEGFSVGIYDGINYTAYGATTNTQGQWSRANGYKFIHMELERFIRDSQSQWENVIDAIKRTFLPAPDAISSYPHTVPQHIHLLTNYPNPFNPDTFIRFTLSRADHIRLHIYAMSGQLVRNIFSGHLGHGDHIVHWDGLDQNNGPVASGMYILRLTTSQHQLFQKIQLIK